MIDVLSEDKIASYWLSALVDSADDAIISKTLDGIITSWNKGATQVFGYMAEEAIGKPILILIPPELHAEESEIISKTLDGIITSWNKGATQVFGYMAEEAIGKPILILIPPELHAEESEIIGKIKAGERVEHYETVRVRKDGSLVEVSLTVSPIKTPEGEIIGASKIAREISQSKLAEER